MNTFVCLLCVVEAQLQYTMYNTMTAFLWTQKSCPGYPRCIDLAPMHVSLADLRGCWRRPATGPNSLVFAKKHACRRLTPPPPTGRPPLTGNPGSATVFGGWCMTGVRLISLGLLTRSVQRNSQSVKTENKRHIMTFHDQASLGVSVHL